MYLQRIRADVDADIVNYRDRLRFWEEVSEYGVAELQYANTGDMDGLSQWNLLLAYFQASQLAERLRDAVHDAIDSAATREKS